MLLLNHIFCNVEGTLDTTVVQNVQLKVFISKIEYVFLKLMLKRTNKGFKMQMDDSYHISQTLLEQIPALDCVKDFVLDYMHLVCLGVTRKLLNLWVNGSIGCRLQYRDVEKVSVALENLKQYTPKEFARKPRSLKYLKLWNRYHNQ